MKDILYFINLAWLACPDNCFNIILFAFMIIMGAIAGSTESAITLMIAGLVAIIINANYIINQLRKF